jgi:hypothetical protein
VHIDCSCELNLWKLKCSVSDRMWQLLSTGIAILTDYIAATTGVGDSAFTPSMEQVIFALQTNLGLENAQVLCMGLIKIFLLLYYKRIFILETFRIVTNILIAFVAVFGVSIVMVPSTCPKSRRYTLIRAVLGCHIFQRNSRLEAMGPYGVLQAEYLRHSHRVLRGKHSAGLLHSSSSSYGRPQSATEDQ